jgi:multicomponent Na+:H+ antiporter subunit A
VVGLVLDVLRSLGAEIDEHMEERSASAHHDEPDEDRRQPPEPEAERDVEPALEPDDVPAETTAKGTA